MRPRRPSLRRTLTSLLILTGFLALGDGARLNAQEGDWEVETEVAASLYFGNTSQTTINTQLSTSRADSAYDLSSAATFAYGEAENSRGESFVAKRAWDVEASLDWAPSARLSPFAFGQGESSFERRIDFRYNVGGGGKYTFVRNDESRLDLSLALLGEQTFTSGEVSTSAGSDQEVLARCSLRLRGRRELADGDVILSSRNYYRPVLGEYDDYVLETRNSISYALSEVVSLSFSFLDTYDSEAVARGAETNNDGQFLLGVIGRF